METVQLDQAPRIVGLPRWVRGRLIILPVLILAATLSLLYLGQTSDVAATSYDIADLETRKRVLEMQNEQLRLRVAELGSLDRVSREASQRLHMGPPARVVYVTAPVRRIALSPATPTPVASSSLDDPWQSIEEFLSLARQLAR